MSARPRDPNQEPGPATERARRAVPEPGERPRPDSEPAAGPVNEALAKRPEPQRVLEGVDQSNRCPECDAPPYEEHGNACPRQPSDHPKGCKVCGAFPWQPHGPECAAAKAVPVLEIGRPPGLLERPEDIEQALEGAEKPATGWPAVYPDVPKRLEELERYESAASHALTATARLEGRAEELERHVIALENSQARNSHDLHAALRRLEPLEAAISGPDLVASQAADLAARLDEEHSDRLSLERRLEQLERNEPHQNQAVRVALQNTAALDLRLEALEKHQHALTATARLEELKHPRPSLGDLRSLEQRLEESYDGLRTRLEALEEAPAPRSLEEELEGTAPPSRRELAARLYDLEQARTLTMQKLEELGAWKSARDAGARDLERRLEAIEHTSPASSLDHLDDVAARTDRRLEAFELTASNQSARLTDLDRRLELLEARGQGLEFRKAGAQGLEELENLTRNLARPGGLELVTADLREAADKLEKTAERLEEL